MKRHQVRAMSIALAAVLALSGCATAPSYDYSAFRQSHPQSILVLPPVNESPAVDASYSMLSQMTLPLAESGYYVLPVTLVSETFRQNGLANPAEIESVSLEKLRQYFGADAALYVHISQFGTVYTLLNSATVVTASGRLVDLRTGTLLWQGKASASSAEGRQSSGGLVGLLVQAIVTQIIESNSDVSHKIAGQTSGRLLAAGQPGGILYGPRSPNFEKP